MLSAYDFNIAYRPEKVNPADGPSRRPDYGHDVDRGELMLPTLQRKLRVAQQSGFEPRQPASGSPDEIRAVATVGVIGLPCVADKVRRATGSTLDSKMDEGAFALEASDEPGKHRISSSVDLLAEEADHPEGQVTPSDETSGYELRSAGKALDAGTSSHEYFVPRIAVRAVTASETAWSAPSESLLPILLDLQKDDELALAKRQELADGPSDAGKADWTEDSKSLLRYQGAAYVPPDGAVRDEIMKINHDDPTAGHYGQKKTLELVRRKYYWPAMHKDVAEYVQTCDLCQRAKAVCHRPYGKLQGLPLPSGLFKSISMDFVIGLSPSVETAGEIPYNALLVIVDRYSKVVKYIPCQDTIQAPRLAWLFLKN